MGMIDRPHTARRLPAAIAQFVWSALALLLVPIAHARAEEGKTPPAIRPMALMSFESSEKQLAESAEKVGAVLGALLSARSDVLLLERSEVDEALAADPGQPQGEDARVARIAFHTGAKLVVAGRVFSSDQDLFVVAKVIGTDTGRTYGEMVRMPMKQSLSVAVEQLAAKVGALMLNQTAGLFGHESEREASLAAIRRSSEGKRLPLLSLRTLESRSGDATKSEGADELAELLREAGFAITRSKGADSPAELELNARILTERGPRKGELHAARAKIEIKVMHASSGALLGSIRRSELAFAADEATAARAALRSVVFEAAEHIPSLVL